MQWNTSLYDLQHDFVSKYGEELIELLNPQAGEHILDLGCGTGDLAALISKKGAIVTALDHSAEMVEAARQKYPQLHIDIQSAADFHYEEKVEAVFSNATLHWVLDYKEAVRCIYNVLKPNGRFVAEFGGKGNVFNILNALRASLIKQGFAGLAAQQIWYFPSLAEYTTLLEQNGFRVVWASHFDRETLLKEANGIQNWLLQFAQPYLQLLSEEQKIIILKDVEEQLRPTNFKNGNWYADYVRLRIMAIKQ
jgi:trans-aconitate methyltransferase